MFLPDMVGGAVCGRGWWCAEGMARRRHESLAEEGGEGWEGLRREGRVGRG